MENNENLNEELKEASEKPRKKKLDSDEGSMRHVYIGPSLPGGRLEKNAVFTNSMAEIETYFGEEFVKYPQLGRLFVPVESLGEQKEKASTPGNALYKHYQDVALALKDKEA